MEPTMKFLYHLVLAVLLLASLAAGTVAAVWRWAPERVEELDEKIVQRYEQEPTDELIRLMELAEDAPAEALPGIRALVKELEPYQDDDRRLPQRLAANRLLIESLVATGETEEGLAIAKQFAHLNPFDHSTRRWVANQMLLAGPPYFQEGIAMLTNLFETFPEDPTLARMLASTWSDAGEETRAVEVALAHLEAIPDESKSFEQFNRPWLYSATAEKKDLGKTSTGSLELTDGLTHLVFSIPVPLDVRFISLSAPIRPQAAFGPPVISITTGATTEFRGLLSELTTDVRNATLDEQGLVLDGGLRPTFIISLPEPQEPKDNAEGALGDGTDAGEDASAEEADPAEEERKLRRAKRFEALASYRLIRIGFPTTRFPRWIEDLLVSESAAPKVAAIKAAAEESLRSRFFAERVSITRAYGMAFRGPSFHVEGREDSMLTAMVRDDRGTAHASHSAESGDLTFKGEYSLEGEAETLDLVVPAVTGAVIDLTQVEWVNADGQAVPANAVTALDPLQLAVVEEGARAWRVLPGALNPTLRISRPAGSGLTCQLRGGLR